YLEILEKGYLELLNFVAKQDKIPIFIQNVILYELFWQVQDLVNHPEKLSFMNQVKICQYLDLLDQIFYFIDRQSIIKFNFNS
ncbi:capsular biosynthesis protein, partial [Campylobacter jejuni]|nr:capsular biosynthesis protein [Campylobacter jejuni]